MKHDLKNQEQNLTGTVIFDLDSTILQTESLEELLKLTASSEQLEKIAAITSQGMDGLISFSESLQKRLDIAAVRQIDLLAFLEKVPMWISPAMKAYIERLKNHKVEVWILSGGLHEVVQAAAQYLGIDANKAFGVKLRWYADRRRPELDPLDPFAQGKTHGAKIVGQKWPKPAVIVGDGYTDFELFAKDQCQHFVAYTEHVQRPRVIAAAKAHSQAIANNCQELENAIFRILNAGTPYGQKN